MKNQFKYLVTALLAVFLMVACEKEQLQTNNDLIDSSASSRGEKVTICHNGHTITVSENALQAHLNHGDSEGACDSGGDDGDSGEDDGDSGGDDGDGDGTTTGGDAGVPPTGGDDGDGDGTTTGGDAGVPPI